MTDAEKYACKPCDCEDWVRGMKWLNSVHMMAHVHGHPDFTGKTFQFCPWCGKKLEPLDRELER